MSDNLFNNSHQLLYLASLEGIRTSQKSTIFYSKLFTGLFGKSTAAIGGRVAKYPKGAEYSKSSKHSKGKPQLNGYLTSAIKIAPLGAFELDSNRSNTAVNQAKILFQSHELPPLNPVTSIKIDHQIIPIGFGGGREGVGSVGVELESNCSRIAVNKGKMNPLQTLSTFEVGICRESYSAPDGIRSS